MVTTPPHPLTFICVGAMNIAWIDVRVVTVLLCSCQFVSRRIGVFFFLFFFLSSCCSGVDRDVELLLIVVATEGKAFVVKCCRSHHYSKTHGMNTRSGAFACKKTDVCVCFFIELTFGGYIVLSRLLWSFLERLPPRVVAESTPLFFVSFTDPDCRVHRASAAEGKAFRGDRTDRAKKKNGFACEHWRQFVCMDGSSLGAGIIDAGCMRQPIPYWSET